MQLKFKRDTNLYKMGNICYCSDLTNHFLSFNQAVNKTTSLINSITRGDESVILSLNERSNMWQQFLLLDFDLPCSPVGLKGG